jgi:hypothetical protein
MSEAGVLALIMGFIMITVFIIVKVWYDLTEI